MRTSASRVLGVFLCALLMSASVTNAEDKFPISLLKSAGSSAAGSAAEFGAKFVGNMYYSGACTGKTLEAGQSYICGIIGNFTGKKEEEFREEIKKQLTAMSTQLKSLDEGQKRLERSFDTADQTAYLRFKQAAAESHVTRIFIEIKTLWRDFDTIVKAPSNNSPEQINAIDKPGMLKLAEDIRKAELDKDLDRLHTLMTEPVFGSQPLLRYEFVEKRTKSDSTAGVLDLYDSVEKTYADVLMDEQKAYVMVLWAAQVAQADCSGAQCASIQTQAEAFKKKFENNTRKQAEAFNKAVDWYILSFDTTHGANPMILPPDGTEIVRRANYMTSTILTGDDKKTAGHGMWGRVYAMGPGTVHIRLTCGGRQKVLVPLLDYAVPVHDPSRSLDWWTSTAGDNVYDHVRFANDWHVLHYRWEDAPEGPCTIDENLAGDPKRMLPWRDPAAGVAKIERTAGAIPFGSFLAIQRAGGTYALVSGGNWKRRTNPVQEESGSAKIADHRFDWRIETGRTPPWISVLSEGFGRYVVGKGSTVDNKTQIHILSQKKIFFPDDPVVKLHYKQDPDCAGVCRDGKTSDLTVLEYNVDNSDVKKEMGFLNAAATVYFSSTPHFRDSGYDGTLQFPEQFAKSGVWVEVTTGPSGGNKQGRSENPSPGTVHTKPGQPYYLNYLITSTMKTTGKGLDATHWMYRYKLTPSMLYVTK